MSALLSRLANYLWYEPNPYAKILLPATYLYKKIVTKRRKHSLTNKKIYKAPVPVIIVGNLTVGGSGKTPLVIHLALLLQSHGYTPGIISRGYGGKTKHPCLVTTQSRPHEVGDEAVLITRRTNSPMVVDPVRSRGIDFLLQHYPVDIIISDDGLQHYALARDLEILVIDGQRRFGNGYCLPAGPLREPAERAESIFFKVCNGAAKKGEYGMSLQANDCINLLTQERKPLNEFHNKSMTAIAGIGNPQRFFDSLTAANIKSHPIIFPDHYAYQASDFNKINSDIILMTEKDAVKCQSIADKRFWYLPVNAKLSLEFDEHIIMKLDKKLGSACLGEFML